MRSRERAVPPLGDPRAFLTTKGKRPKMGLGSYVEGVSFVKARTLRD
jgi:hypothetical protein